MKAKTKWRLGRVLYTAAFVFLFLLFVPLDAIFLIKFNNQTLVKVFEFIHYAALPALVVAIIFLGPIDKPKDEEEKKPNIFKSIFSSPSTLIPAIIALAVAFGIGFGVSSLVRRELPHYYNSGYVVNTSTHKIHASTCAHVKEMSDKNKMPIEDYETAKDYSDFVPCKDCLPAAYYEYYK